MGLAQQCGNKMETILENKTANPTLESRDFFCHTTEPPRPCLYTRNASKGDRVLLRKLYLTN